MRRPSQNINTDTFKTQVVGLWGKKSIFTAPPGLAEMEIGEIAFGNVAQRANLQSIYIKANSLQIAVLNINTATNAVTGQVIT